MLHWRVYYVGYAPFSNEQGRPWDAPATGVQAIVKADDEVGRVVLSTCDYYWWDAERDTWFAGDIAGLHQHLMFALGPKAILFGRYVSNDEYRRCIQAALDDPGFAAKSARHSSDGPLP